MSELAKIAEEAELLSSRIAVDSSYEPMRAVAHLANLIARMATALSDAPAGNVRRLRG